jgi:hypothetical protein
MKKPSHFSARLILMFFFAGLINQVGAQGIRNDGAMIDITSGYVISSGGIYNSSGTITNNGTLILNGGNWINNGAYTTPSAGTVTFNGASSQTINGSSLTTFNNLIIGASSAGTTIVAGARVTVSGCTFSPNGKLTINSDAVNNSGSLIYNGSGTPAGTVTYNRTMPGSTTSIYWHYISSPVSLTVTPSGSFYAWNEFAGDWNTSITGTPASGVGYTLQTAGNSVSFTGSVIPSVSIPATSPYTTDYNLGTLAEYNSRITRNPFGGGGWNLLGNPFTSAMSVTAFLDANDGDGTLATNRFDPNYVAVYIYNGSQYYYRGKTTGFVDPFINEIPANQLFDFDNIQAGQGFFVLVMKNGVTFTFDKSMQTHGTGTTMLKSASVEGDSWPGLRLAVKYGVEENSTLVVYNENMTIGLDQGYDIGQLSTSPEVEIYTSLLEKDNSVNFVQQALPLTNCEKNIIPVGIDTEKGGEVTFSAYTVPIEDKKFWLEDRTKGIFTDLCTSTYTVNLPAKTYGTGRFFIIASTNAPTGINDLKEEAGLELRIWTAGDKVIIKGIVSDKANCEVYEMSGKKVLEIRLNDGELNSVTMPSNSHGAYLIRVMDGVKVYTRKVVFL